MINLSKGQKLSTMSTALTEQEIEEMLDTPEFGKYSLEEMQLIKIAEQEFIDDMITQEKLKDYEEHFTAF